MVGELVAGTAWLTGERKRKKILRYRESPKVLLRRNTSIRVIKIGVKLLKRRGIRRRGCSMVEGRQTQFVGEKNL